MRRFMTSLLLILLLLLAEDHAQANVFGQIRGVVHDPQHRPIAGARVTVKSANSGLSQTRPSGPDGSFAFPAMPLGDYVVMVAETGFETAAQSVTLASGTSPELHFELALGTVVQSVTTEANLSSVDSVTPTTLIGRLDIAQTPGADRTNSMAMITDYVPGA